MNRYESYKDSGVEWLGEVPSHWECMPIRALFNERNERNTGIKTDFILSVTKDRGVIPYDEKGQIGNNKSDDIEKYKLVYPNDLVINKMNVVIGSLGISKYFGAFSHVYLVYYPKISNVEMKYFTYLFSIPLFYKSLIKYCTGIMELRESLNKEHFKKINLPLPPLSEQTAIAQYLDDKTAKIDQAIMLEEKQIELLKEHKQILIQNAVTKGLNPQVKFKDSGVEWLGEVPEHWEVKKIKTFSKINNGLDYKSVMAEEGYPVFGSGGQFAYAKTYLYDGEAILLGRKGTIDKPLYINDKFWTVDTMFYCICNKFIHTKFVYYCCCSLIPFGYYSTSTALPSMTQSDLLNNKFTIPPISEQHQIANYLDQQTAKIDHAIQLKQQQINKLKEYKTVLINDVVTGKVKVA